MEVEEQKDAIRNVLEFLLETEHISHNASKGIAKKILTDGNADGLSAKQLNVFDKYIEPFIDVTCSSEGCGNEIGILNLREAYNNQDEFGGLLCVDCTIDRGRLK